MPPRLRMIGVQKSFGATRALRGVDLEVAPGEVHALIGENGAGKSTLMKVLSGAHPPDSGRIELDGKPFTPDNPLHARRCGISMIYQELNLAPHLTVSANIVLGSEPHTWGWLDKKGQRDRARQALAELQHENIPLDTPVQTLTIAQQQIVEIARALVEETRVVIMDEPTSSLTQVDTETLFAVIDRLQNRGVSIVYISHFLEECQRICQRFTVLRDGESVGTGEMKTASLNHIIHLMVGRELKEIYPRHDHTIGKPVFQLEGVAGESKPRRVDLTLREGEIFGVAGLVGAGRTETLRAVFGLDKLKTGYVYLAGQDVSRSDPSLRLQEGIGLLSENRKTEGLMLNQSIADNLTLTRYEPVASNGFIFRKQQEATARNWVDQLEIRCAGPSQAVGELSGGNQQKVAIGRLLHHDARILLLDEPTRGIDVASKVQIYRLMGELASRGKSVIFVSSYLPELLGICDTIGVMCRGELREVRPVNDWTEHEIIRVAIGQNAVEKDA